MHLTEKQVEDRTSKMSLTFIEHNDKMQKEHHTKKELVNEIRTLEKQIVSKNNEIEALNLKCKKNEGFANHQIKKLEDQIIKLQDEHQRWIDQQDKENQDWNRERG